MGRFSELFHSTYLIFRDCAVVGSRKRLRLIARAEHLAVSIELVVEGVVAAHLPAESETRPQLGVAFGLHQRVVELRGYPPQLRQQVPGHRRQVVVLGVKTVVEREPIAPAIVRRAGLVAVAVVMPE